MDYNTLLIGLCIGALITMSALVLYAFKCDDDNKHEAAIEKKDREIGQLKKDQKKEIQELRGVKLYRSCGDLVWATKVVERRGSNTKFYLDEDLVASMPEGSAYSLYQG